MTARGTEQAQKRGFCTCCIAVWLSVTVCVLSTALLNTSTVRGMQDDQGVAARSKREAGAKAKNAYAGQAKCLTCHTGLSSQPSTEMGMAAIDPESPSSRDYSSTSYRDGPYSVTLTKGHEGLQMTASDDKASMAIPVRWIFGQGFSGQTFILEQEGKFYESRASYYKAISNLDITIGHSKRPPGSLLAALGRPLPVEEVNKCFSCHTSEDVFDGKLDVNQAHPGVTCENCHRAGSHHVSMMAGTYVQEPGKPDSIFNPGLLAPADLNDFCGSCHRTTRDVLDLRIRDIRNIRFQPYRLENSRCYDPSDARITCVACHDPHRKLETSSIEYDTKCLACHSLQGDRPTPHKAAACPRAAKNCVTCHMPKLNLPGAHFAFTDHYIRTVLPNAPYPD